MTVMMIPQNNQETILKPLTLYQYTQGLMYPTTYNQGASQNQQETHTHTALREEVFSTTSFFTVHPMSFLLLTLFLDVGWINHTLDCITNDDTGLNRASENLMLRMMRR